MTIKDILVPIDFSRCSAAALDTAMGLAERFGSQLHLLHVYVDPLASVPFGRNSPSGPPAAPPEVIAEAKAERAAEAAKLQARAETRGVNAKVDEVEGEPKKMIPEYAQQIGADMIVMGTHGRSGVSRMLMGSVAERVVRAAKCPVMTVPREGGGDMEAAAIRRIVCATDFSKASEHAVEMASTLAKQLGAKLTLVHVVHASPYLGWDGAAAMAAVHDAYVEDLRRRAEESLTELAQRQQGVQVETSAINGVPHETLASLSKETDLLVLGTHGRTGLEHVLVGSVAERTVRLAECPVVVVK